ncbi:MAG: FecR family protein [Chitinophagaceae bacterium]|nr:MAG: FecR family protein [Chitinophagaceae bacterium]
MEKDRIWTLMARKLAGEITAAEQTELEHFIRTNPDIHFPIQTISDLWHPDTYNEDPEEPDAETEAAYEAHIERLRTANPAAAKSGTINLLPYFVTLVAVLIITYLLLPGKKTPATTPALSEITTKKGSKTKTVLPDGSQVWLNANTKLTYNAKFGKDHREVKLAGEAFFIVVPDSARPFIIHTSDMDLKVVGTSFNVKSYPGEQTSEAALISGSLEIRLTAGERQKIILSPSQKLVISNDSVPPANTANPGKTVDEPIAAIKNITHFKQADSIIIETSWVENQLVFQDEPLQSIALKMEKWYGVPIHFEKEFLKHLRFTGIFEKETLKQALYALSLTGDFDYEIGSAGVKISPVSP